MKKVNLPAEARKQALKDIKNEYFEPINNLNQYFGSDYFQYIGKDLLKDPKNTNFFKFINL